MLKHWKGRLGVLGVCLASAVWLAGCGPGPQPQEEAQQPTEEEILAATLMAPTARPSVSVNELMVALVDHAAHEIWNAPVTPPQTENEWLSLEYHAVQLAGAATLISLGGSGEADPGWARLPAWAEHAQALQDSAMAAHAAAQSHSVGALSQIADDLTTTCEACHNEFKPDSPTEGLIHMPYDFH